MIGGDPGRPLFEVTLDNWQSDGQLHYSLQHLAELFPAATISRGGGPVAHFRPAAQDLTSIEVTTFDGKASTVGEVFSKGHTDGWMVLHGNRVVAEEYPAMPPAGPHMLMSVSKSIVGSLVGILASRGMLDLRAPVDSYVPELASSGYRGAAVQHLLDMRSGIKFSEKYLDLDSEVRQIEQAIGWAPKRSSVPDGMYPFLRTLVRDRPHGGVFEYRSCESDVLGWVCEAATGRPFVELASDLLWCKIGAEADAKIAIDSFGTPMYDGGMSTTLADLARFGLLYVNHGRTWEGVTVLPSGWVQDTWEGAADSRLAFAAAPDSDFMPGGMYRNQFWFPHQHRDVALALGIHGQMIYLNRAEQLVGVKLSSWPLPQDAWRLYSTLAAFDAIAAQLATQARKESA